MPHASMHGSLRIHRLGLAPPLAAVAIGELILAPGSLTLICGHSGAGKSSLMDVLAGMVEPRVFAAQCEGQTLDFAAYRALVRHGAYVGQGVRPWQRTVRDCLAWAEPGASGAAMWQALRDVGLAARLHDGGHGLDTCLNSAASKLSGGELQRLLLAQVILRQPRIALLDEATSALDAASEKLVLSALRQRLPHTALVMVSHRTSLASIADRCLVLERQGPVPMRLADGTH